MMLLSNIFKGVFYLGTVILTTEIKRNSLVHNELKTFIASRQNKKNRELVSLLDDTCIIVTENFNEIIDALEKTSQDIIIIYDDRLSELIHGEAEKDSIIFFNELSKNIPNIISIIIIRQNFESGQAHLNNLDHNDIITIIPKNNFLENFSDVIKNIAIMKLKKEYKSNNSKENSKLAKKMHYIIYL